MCVSVVVCMHSRFVEHIADSFFSRAARWRWERRRRLMRIGYKGRRFEDFNMATVCILPYLSGAGKSVTTDILAYIYSNWVVDMSHGSCLIGQNISRWESFPITTIHKLFFALLDSCCRPHTHQHGPGRVAEELWHWSLRVRLKCPAGCFGKHCVQFCRGQ